MSYFTRHRPARRAVARVDEDNPLDQLLRLHWSTTYTDGPDKGEPCCACCAWLDGVRKPWPCETLQAVHPDFGGAPGGIHTRLHS
jgi:hypothetical protein